MEQGKKTFLKPIGKKGDFEVITKYKDGKIIKDFFSKEDKIKGGQDGENSKI